MDVDSKIVKKIAPGSEEDGPFTEMADKKSKYAKDQDTARRVVKNILK